MSPRERDECARLMGWTLKSNGMYYRKDKGTFHLFDILPSTLDAISAAMETHAKGWRYEITRESVRWLAEAWWPSKYKKTAINTYADTEKRARLELLLLVLRVEAEKKKTEENVS